MSRDPDGTQALIAVYLPDGTPHRVTLATRPTSWATWGPPITPDP